MRRSFLLISVLIPLITGCASEQRRSAASDSLSNQKSLAKTESEELMKVPKNTIKRDKDRLTLNFANKKDRVIKDNLQEGTENYIRSFLVDYIGKHDVAVIQQLFYEGGRFLVVSLKDGSEIVTPTKPIWSPDLSNFISVNDDESDYTENLVIIGSCKLNKCSKVYSEDTHSGAEQWLDSNTVQFEKRKFDPATGKSEAQVFTCTIKNKVTCKVKR